VHSVSKMSEDMDQINETGLTKEEEDKCWEAFSAFDKEQTGYINSNELKHVLEIME
jgi:Ca2+-binding EF-hand superfamily protein